jgi:hypothetical protein
MVLTHLAPAMKPEESAVIPNTRDNTQRRSEEP